MFSYDAVLIWVSNLSPPLRRAGRGYFSALKAKGEATKDCYAMFVCPSVRLSVCLFNLVKTHWQNTLQIFAYNMYKNIFIHKKRRIVIFI